MGEYNPIDRNYVYQYNQDLDLEKMRETSQIFMGTHNFKSFVKTTEEIQDYVRTIYKIEIDQFDNMIQFTFVGNGFLRYMVRNLVGSLMEVGEGKRTKEEVLSILESQDRTKAGKTAPPEGLYLEEVYYKEFI